MTNVGGGNPPNPYFDILLAQYQECGDDHRHYSALIWQVPSVAAAIGGGIFVAAFGTPIGPYVRPFIILSGLFFDLVLIIALERYRMFELARRIDMKEIEKKLATHTNLTIPRSGEPILGDPKRYEFKRNWYNQKSAFNWLKTMMFALVVGLGVALLYSILIALNVAEYTSK